MDLDRERVEVGEFEGVLKGEEARLLALQEQRMSSGSKIRRRGRRVVEIYGKAGGEGKGEEVERRVRNGSKEKEVFAFGVELLQRAAQRISPGSLGTCVPDWGHKIGS